MRRFVFLGLFLAATTTIAQAQPAYQSQIVTTAQEALIRLGYDPGGVDGKWGGKARAAMNALREANGLPAAKDFVGSSLELIHRLSPGPTTLPHPGIVVTDPVARAALLPSLRKPQPERNLCQGPVGPDDEELSEFAEGEVLRTVKPGDVSLGYLQRKDDWFTPFMHAVTASHNACMAGDKQSCETVVEFMSKWADADALKPGIKKGPNRQFSEVAWYSNSALRTFIFAYADVRKLAQVEPAKDAAILDWMKRRVDDYHYIRPSGNDPFSPDYYEGGNHAMADMMPALAFGAMVGDRSMMEPAFATWREIQRVMRDDGSFPNETKRGARSLHYTTFQIGQLLATQAVAAAQGIDPADPAATTGGTIPQAVDFLLDAIENFDVVKPYAKENEGPGPSDDYTIPFLSPMHMGWVPAYFARYGDDENIQRMRTLQIDSRACSEAGIEDGKLPDNACRFGKAPTLKKMILLWETTDLPYMGYSAACLQGGPKWALDLQ